MGFGGQKWPSTLTDMSEPSDHFWLTNILQKANWHFSLLLISVVYHCTVLSVQCKLCVPHPVSIFDLFQDCSWWVCAVLFRDEHINIQTFGLAKQICFANLLFGISQGFTIIVVMLVLQFLGIFSFLCWARGLWSILYCFHIAVTGSKNSHVSIH